MPAGVARAGGVPGRQGWSSPLPERASKSEESAQRLGGLDSSSTPPPPEVPELRLLRAIGELQQQVRPVADVEKAVRVAARSAAGLFRAEDYCVGVIVPGASRAELIARAPRSEAWDLDLLGAFARGERPEVPANVMLARLKRRGRAWGALALRYTRAEPDWALRNALTKLAAAINESVAAIERDRLVDARGRIDRKIMEQLRPRDLFYQILDALRSLTRYDHSAAMLIGESGEDLELVAEQLAWRKGKSRVIGRRRAISDDLRAALADGVVRGFTRAGGGWEPWEPGSPAGLAELLDWGDTPGTSDAGESCAEGEIICAPMATRDGMLAVLKVSARHAGTFGPYEAGLVSEFVPQASVALQNSRRAETLQAKMLEAERKHAMADLARGVAHDVNNALGSVLPLVQQMRADLAEGRFDAGTFNADLAQIDRAVQVCRRIFGGMLNFARGAAKPGGSASVDGAVEQALALLGESLERKGIAVRAQVGPELPHVGVGTNELAQLFINLISNARDAMEGGGTLDIHARLAEGLVEIKVRDSGRGIKPEDMPLIQEPFFTTKRHGTGLGLSICRTIVWQSQGRLSFESAVGKGTCVTVVFPAGEPPRDPEAADAAPQGSPS